MLDLILFAVAFSGWALFGVALLMLRDLRRSLCGHPCHECAGIDACRETLVNEVSV